MRNPYIFGSIAVVPSLDFKFSKNDELTILFYIYNAGLDQAGKPDLTVDYNFYQKTGDAEKFFNKTPELELNAQDTASDVRRQGGSSAQRRAGTSSGELPRGRVPRRDQDRRQADRQDEGRECSFHGDAVTGGPSAVRPARTGTAG